MSAVAMATEERTDRWLPHRVFDWGSALEHGPGPYACPGDMVFDPDAVADGDTWVAVECDHCIYAVGVKREVVEDTPVPLQGDERPDRWWNR